MVGGSDNVAWLSWSLGRWKTALRLRIGFVVLSGAVLLSLSFLEHGYYASEVKLVYVENGMSAPGALLAPSSAMSALQSLGLGSPGSSAQLPEILRSRSLVSELLGDSVTFDSKRMPAYLLYGEQNGSLDSGMEMNKAIDNFRRTYLQANYDPRTDLVRLQLLAPSPELAQFLADRMAELLNQRLVKNSTMRARRQERFIAERLKEVEIELREAEQSLKVFREENRSIQDSPRLRMEEARIVRRVSLNEQLFTTLSAQYELAKIEGVKNLPVIDILDSASLPYQRATPRRSFRLAAGLFLGIMLLIGWDAIRYLRELQPSEG